jgi:hypothetical protein
MGIRDAIGWIMLRALIRSELTELRRLDPEREKNFREEYTDEFAALARGEKTQEGLAGEQFPELRDALAHEIKMAGFHEQFRYPRDLR